MSGHYAGMKKLFCLVAVFGLICVGLMSGCSQQSSSTPPATTNAPAQ
ncbi:MAG TPA: hypothetical protein VMD27_13420 [Candidatus Aquilonibacter sp.]|nr:hypothetical protein [Candidatus Aquilonibacter sp.]